MKKTLVCFSTVTIVGWSLFSGCTPIGWSQYRSGMRCHLKNDPECELFYKKAIAQNPKLPGLHSSYATYLYSKDKKDEAAMYFNKEVELYPQAKKAVDIALDPILEKNSQDTDSSEVQ